MCSYIARISQGVPQKCGLCVGVGGTLATGKGFDRAEEVAYADLAPTTKHAKIASR